MRTVVAVLAWIARLLMAAFFCFVGYFKALGPWEVLVEHHAWVTALSPALARAVGWSEIALGVLLLAAVVASLRRASWWAAVILVVNQLCATWIHFSRQEFDALPQNVVIVALLALIIASDLKRKNV
jgi:uncharacterized membrane protein YphA (DoxX/SURF4 family)